MFDKLMSRISDIMGVTALKQEIRLLRAGIASLHEIYATQELRAATWHAESLNQQLKLETSISQIELISAQLSSIASGKPLAEGPDSYSASTLEELKSQVQKLHQVLVSRENGISQ